MPVRVFCDSAAPESLVSLANAEVGSRRQHAIAGRLHFSAEVAMDDAPGVAGGKRALAHCIKTVIDSRIVTPSRRMRDARLAVEELMMYLNEEPSNVVSPKSMMSTMFG